MCLLKQVTTTILLVSMISGCMGNRTTMLDIRNQHHAQRYDQAVLTYEQNRDALEAEPDLRFKYAQWRRNLCESYLELHRFNEFFACANEAKRGAERHPELLAMYAEDYALLHSALAEAYLMLGLYEVALAETEITQQLFEKYTALEVDNEIYRAARQFAQFRANETRGKTLALLGRHKEARQLIDEMKVIIKKNNWLDEGIASAMRRNILNRVSSIYIAMDDYMGARDTLLLYQGKGNTESIMDGLTVVLGFAGGVLPLFVGLPPHPEAFSDFVTHVTYEDIAYEFRISKVAYETGDIKAAKAGYDKLLSYNGAGIWGDLSQFGNIYYVVLHDRGRIARDEGDKVAALKHFSDAIAVIESQRSTIQSEAAKIGFVGDKQAVYADLIDLLVSVGDYDQAFNYAERGKARALVDMLAVRAINHEKTSQAPLHMASIAEIDRVEARSLSFANANDDKQRAADRALIKSRIDTLKSQQPELASLVTVSAPQLAELQQRLAPDETLIEYYGSGNNLYAFVLSRKGVGAIKLNGRDLSASVARFRNALTNPQSHAYRSEGRALYARLIAPLENQISTRNITFVPHGELHYLPFAALPMERDFLIDGYSLRVLPSASVLQFIPKSHQAKSSLLVLGNPDLNDANLDLPGAQAEAKAIAKRHSGAQLLLRGEASESAVKQYAGNYKFLHFASHGVFDPDKPLDSGLLLAADQQNDGTLTVGELYNLNLNADLVTLSACETALGKIANGDDVVGFTRGFLYAGANSIVSSLWKVDDKATSDLMQEFYAAMKTKSKRESLRAAQLQVKNSMPHPYYWAAFQLTGSVN